MALDDINTMPKRLSEHIPEDDRLLRRRFHTRLRISDNNFPMLDLHFRRANRRYIPCQPREIFPLIKAISMDPPNPTVRKLPRRRKSLIDILIIPLGHETRGGGDTFSRFATEGLAECLDCVGAKIHEAAASEVVLEADIILSENGWHPDAGCGFGDVGGVDQSQKLLPCGVEADVNSVEDN